MYLSKVHLDWGSTRNPYDWHRALWQLFPGRPGEQRAFLFRVEQFQSGHGALVLLQSPTPPAQMKGAVRLLAEPRQFDHSALQQGMCLRFRLTANVIKTIRDAKNPERPVRVPLIKVDEQLDWLARKVAHAAELHAVMAAPNPPLFFRRQGRAGKLVTVTFNGLLTIRDQDAFGEAMESGIGAAKSFGCGLLSLAPA